MHTHRRSLALMALIAPWLITSAGRVAAQAPAPEAPAVRPPLDDLSTLRAIAMDALQLARSGDLHRARARVEALEVQWRRAESSLRSLSPQRRQAIDTAIDRVERELRFWRARRTDSAAALQKLVDVIDESS